MAKVIYLDKLLRLTLTRRGKAVAKHPYLRENVVEAVKASDVPQNETASPLWTIAKASDDDKTYDGDAVSIARWQSGRWQ